MVLEILAAQYALGPYKLIGRGAETWPAEATTGLLRFGYTRVTPGFLDLVFLAALIPGIKGSQRRVSARLVQRFLD